MQKRTLAALLALALKTDSGARKAGKATAKGARKAGGAVRDAVTP